MDNMTDTVIVTIGQRWLYASPSAKFIIEILNVNSSLLDNSIKAQIIQVMSPGIWNRKVRNTNSDWSLHAWGGKVQKIGLEASWTLLSGQEAPANE
jgi:hypothetical protein